MKKIFIILILYGLTCQVKSQPASVITTTFGIQTGFLGIWVHNESRIADHVALRSELGFDAGLQGGTHAKTEYILSPVISLAPRWYYNLDRRNSKGKRTEGNSGNFISLKLRYYPDWFNISSSDIFNVRRNIALVPTWGIRRNIGGHLTTEAGAGVGYLCYLSRDQHARSRTFYLTFDLLLRVGYRF